MNILEITTLYPKNDNKERATEFLHEYNKGLCKNHTVKVVFLSRKYPKIFKYVRRLPIIKKYTSAYSDKTHLKKDEIYLQGSIPVYEMPINKFIPHGDFPKSEIKRCKKKVQAFLKEQNFTPDIVLLDFLCPSIFFEDIFDKNCKICAIPHHTDLSYCDKNKAYAEISSKLDAILYRSPMQKKLFEAVGVTSDKSFIMISGVPSEVIENRILDHKVKSFLTVCRFTKTKNIHSVIRSLSKLTDRDWTYTIVGQGEEREAILQAIEEYGISDRCNLIDWLPKTEVYKLMVQSDCFIMPSIKETFGMVYLEAMAKGCIAIGSKNEGCDGIIVNGENGFLADPNSLEDIENTIKLVMDMPVEEIERVSKNAIDTAKMSTNEKLVESIESFFCEIVEG